MKPFAALFLAALMCGVVLRAQAVAPSTSPQTTNFAPLDYFNDKCAKCHGNYGSNYGKEFAKGMSDADLAATVKQMCEGPAQAPLSPHDLDVLVAWHRSMRDGKPFVASVKLDGGVWSGEATPGSTVVLQTTTGAQSEAPLKEHRWSAGLPDGVQMSSIKVKNGDQTTELDPRKAAYAPK